jgi:hypothetical protein
VCLVELLGADSQSGKMQRGEHPNHMTNSLPYCVRADPQQMRVLVSAYPPCLPCLPHQPQHYHGSSSSRLDSSRAVYSFAGLATAVLLLVCSCAFIRGVPALRSFFLQEKKGFFGTFYKGMNADGDDDAWPRCSSALLFLALMPLSGCHWCEAALAGVAVLRRDGHLPNVFPVACLRVVVLISHVLYVVVRNLRLTDVLRLISMYAIM